MIATALIFIIIGIAIKYGKMYFLIAGYNTLSKEDQKKIDIQGIANLLRNVMFTMALILIAGYFIVHKFNIDIEDILITCTTVIGVLFLVIRSNSKKYKL